LCVFYCCLRAGKRGTPRNNVTRDPTRNRKATNDQITEASIPKRRAVSGQESKRIRTDTGSI